MHPSYFLILSSVDEELKIELTISGETSEWLCHIKFWDEINEKFKTQFAHYEEDCLQGFMIGDTVALLRASISEFLDDFDIDVKFRYGWTQNKEELFCLVKSGAIVDDVNLLIELLEKADLMSSDVYCQL
ncbi:hypothetical protein HSX11_14950 [Oxalobacteraceae bacterium]|nr:hypothetical protein [Oxalobacteraceae bacterium]